MLRAKDVWESQCGYGRVDWSSNGDVSLPQCIPVLRRYTSDEHRFDDLAGIRRLDPGRPSFGREFSDAIARKIGQPREHRVEVVAEWQSQAATSFDDRNDGGCHV